MNLAATTGQTAEGLARQLGTTVKAYGDEGWQTNCIFPQNHKNGDRNPSLLIYQDDKGLIRWECKGGCDWQQLTDEINRRGLNPNPKPKSETFKPWEHEPVDQFNYYDAAGKWQYRKNRYVFNGEKEFTFWHKDGKGGWRRPGEPQLYNLPPAREAIARGEIIFFTEGEADIKYAVKEFGYEGLSVDSGSGATFYDRYLQDLEGAQSIYWLRDEDKPGYEYANRGCAFFTDHGIPCYWVNLPGIEDLKIGADVRDWKNAGNGLIEFMEAIDNAQLWTEAVPCPQHLIDSFNALKPKKPAKKDRKTEGNVTFLNEDGMLVNPQLLWTDIALGNNFIDDHAAITRHAEKLGWFVWDGKRWQHDEENRYVGRLAELTALRVSKAIEGKMPPKDEARALKYIQSESGRSAMLRKAARHEKVTCAADAFDSQSHLLNVNNGVIDLRDGVKHPHDPKFMCSKMIPIDWNPKAKCERWNQFLLEIFCDDQEMVTFIEDSFGWALTGDYSDHKIFFFYGEGRNGKSKLLETVCGVMGDYSFTAAPEMWMSRHQRDHGESLIHVMGSRIVISGEVKENDKLDVGRVKGYTGGDKQNVRQLYGKSTITFQPTGKLIMFGNHKPRITDLTNSIWDRWLMVPFERNFSENPDLQLSQKLQAESEGILYRLVMGACRWYEMGLMVPAKVSAATKGYQEDSNIARSFGIDCFECEFEEENFKDFHCKMSIDGQLIGELGDTIHRAYLEWCKEKGIKFPMDRNNFYGGLKQWKFPKRKEDGWHYAVQLKPEWKPPDATESRYAKYTKKFYSGGDKDD